MSLDHFEVSLVNTFQFHQEVGGAFLFVLPYSDSSKKVAMRNSKELSKGLKKLAFDSLELVNLRS